MTSNTELERTARLLNDVFDHADPLTVESLRWYYDENPAGTAAVGRVEQDGRRIGNYALVPNRFRTADGQVRVLGLGVDLAVDPLARGSGAFRRTVEDSYERGRAAGFDGILGVANANSAPRMVSTLGWRALDPLPVTLVPAIGSTRGFRSCAVTDAVLEELETHIGSEFVRSSESGFAPVWTFDLLRWRLGRPGHAYSLHVSDDIVVVSTRATVARMPFGIILGVLARRRCAAVPIGRVASVIGRHHRAPFVIHWGRAPILRVRGIRLPQRFMPSPLSLVLHGFVPDFDVAGFELGEFGFLDFDAY